MIGNKQQFFFIQMHPDEAVWTQPLTRLFLYHFPYIIVVFKKGQSYNKLFSKMLISPLIIRRCKTESCTTSDSFKTRFDIFSDNIWIGGILLRVPSIWIISILREEYGNRKAVFYAVDLLQPENLKVGYDVNFKLFLDVSL